MKHENQDLNDFVRNRDKVCVVIIRQLKIYCQIFKVKNLWKFECGSIDMDSNLQEIKSKAINQQTNNITSYYLQLSIYQVYGF